MRNRIWLVAMLGLGLIFCVDGAFAKDKKGGGKKNKNKSSEVAKPVESAGEAATIAGTVVVEGDVVKLVCEDKSEYLLAASTATANKGKNGQKISVTGTVTAIEGKKWLTADPAPVADKPVTK